MEVELQCRPGGGTDLVHNNWVRRGQKGIVFARSRASRVSISPCYTKRSDKSERQIRPVHGDRCHCVRAGVAHLRQRVGDGL